MVIGNVMTHMSVGGAGAPVGNVIQGNSIGVGADGKSNIGDTVGIDMVNPDAAIVGGSDREAGNVIGNQSFAGIHVSAPGSFAPPAAGKGPVIQGNYIGETPDFTSAPNGIGITVNDPYIGTRPSMPVMIGGEGAGEGNLIASNHGDGLQIVGVPVNRVSLSGNSIRDNGGLGIDIGTDGPNPNDSGDADQGENGLQNFPELLTAMGVDTNLDFAVDVQLNSMPNTAYRVQLFVDVACDPSGFGEGANFVDTYSIVTNAHGAANTIVAFHWEGPERVVTATATDPDGNTSEFSKCNTLADYQPPVSLSATPDAYTVAEDQTLTVPAPEGVLANDAPGGSASRSSAIDTPAAFGAVTLNGDGSFTYTPEANYFGPDSFTYVVSESGGASAKGEVTITVTPADDPPIANDDTFDVPAGKPFSAPTSVLDNDEEFDGDGVVTTVSQEPAHGDLELDVHGQFVYTPAPGYTGTDRFVYRLADTTASHGEGDMATVTLTVGGPAPVVQPPAGTADTNASGSRDHLARTGSHTRQELALAVSLLLAGAVWVALSRRIST